MIALLVGCGGPVDLGSRPSGDSDAPSLVAVTPTDGSTVCGDPLLIELDVENFILVAPAGSFGDGEPGTGHVDLALNGAVVDMTAAPTVSLPVDPGEYQLQATLVNADHTPILPYVGTTLYFTVDPGACGR